MIEKLSYKREVSHSNKLIFRKPVTEISMLKNMNQHHKI